MKLRAHLYTHHTCTNTELKTNWRETKTETEINHSRAVYVSIIKIALIQLLSFLSLSLSPFLLLYVCLYVCWYITKCLEKMNTVQILPWQIDESEEGKREREREQNSWLANDTRKQSAEFKSIKQKAIAGSFC